MKPSREAKQVLRPWYGVVWKILWPWVAILLLLVWHGLDRWQLTRQYQAAAAYQHAQAASEQASCDLMNQLPSHMFIIEAKSKAEATLKLSEIAGQADALRFHLMFPK